MNKYALGLGSNLGDRENYLNQAISIIINNNILKNIIVSKIFKSKAILKQNSPKEWNLDYLNLAITGLSDINPDEMLIELKKIEAYLGRNSSGLWSPREIDIDILAWGDNCFETSNIIIPHKELLNRDFFLITLTEIWPEYLYPVKGKYYKKSIKYLAKSIFGK